MRNAKQGHSAWAAGYGPFLRAIQNAVLPPRGKPGSRANLERMRRVQRILHAVSTGGKVPYQRKA